MNTKQVGVINIPFDDNSSFLKGPSQAPDVITDILTSGSLNKSCENGQLLSWNENIFNLPSVSIPNAQGFVFAIESAVSSAVKKGYSILCLGGDHSISYPILRGIHHHYGQVNIVHFDAHPDLYDEFKGDRYSNACPFARIMEEKLAKSLHQFGIRTLNQHQREQAQKFGVKVNQMKDWPSKMPALVGPVYISIDIDAIDPAFAPGVSHREPGGLSVRDVINLIHQIKAPIIGVDIVEFNPTQDIDNLTAYVAAKLFKEAAGKMLEDE